MTISVLVALVFGAIIFSGFTFYIVGHCLIRESALERARFADALLRAGSMTIDQMAEKLKGRVKE